MSESDISYFQHRAEVELERAQQADRKEVVAAHYRLAEAYLERVASAEPPRNNEHA